MIRRLFTLGSLCCLLSVAPLWAQRDTLRILSVNDMHANLERMPRLAAVADSLRAIDPDLIVLSAGDNRTGNPYNDRHEIAAYPMVALMNAIGFDATAVGNHEWDEGPEGLRRVANLASFPFLCCNVSAPDSLSLPIRPYAIRCVRGVRIGLLGALQTNQGGIPDSHPSKVKQLSFRAADDAIGDFAWLREACDYLILLSHDGYEADIVTAGRYPYFDQIVGGHTHTLAPANDMHSGVLITQAKNKVAYANLTTIVVERGKVVSKTSEIIDVAHFGRSNADVEALVATFKKNAEMERVLTTVARPFQSREELGNMVCDALLAGTGADIALQNGGGVRYDSFPAGPMTVGDVLTLDPFGNEVVAFTMTGREVAAYIQQCYAYDEKQVPFVGGLRYTMTVDADKSPIGISLTSSDGTPFDLDKTYRFVTNSYVSAILPVPASGAGENTYVVAADHIIRYLQQQPSVDYQGTHRATVIVQPKK